VTSRAISAQCVTECRQIVPFVTLASWWCWVVAGFGSPAMMSVEAGSSLAVAFEFVVESVRVDVVEVSGWAG
jgi:hypothetical protein